MSVYALSARQRAHAKKIFEVTHARGLPDLAAVYAIACSGAEASLINWENAGTSQHVGRAEGRQLNDAERAVARRSLGLGDGVPPWGDNLDSMGLFAQRPMSGWGKPEDIMRPEYAIGKFLDALVKVPNWQTAAAPDVIRKVQGYYADIYTSWIETARSVVSDLKPPVPPPPPPVVVTPPPPVISNPPDPDNWVHQLIGAEMAGVGVWFVGYKGTLYACYTATGLYRGMTSMERVEAMRRQLDWAGVPWKDWPQGEPASMEEFGTDIGKLEDIYTNAIKGGYAGSNLSGNQNNISGIWNMTNEIKNKLGA